MKQSIIFFSRTGDTKTKALRLSKQTGIMAYQLKDDVNWQGPLGFLKGYWFSLTNRKMSLKLDQEALNAEQIILMSPVWLQGPTPAVKTLLDRIDHDQIHLVLMNHMSPIEGILKKYKRKYKGIKKTYGITSKKDNATEVLAKLISDMSLSKQ